MSGKYSSVLWFPQVDNEDTNEVGQKAARLGDMTQAGFPVPPGFIITNHAYQNFLHENNLTTRINALLTTANIEDVTSLMQISGQIKKMIMQAHLSEDLVKEIDASYRKFGGLFHHALVTVSLSQKTEDKQSEILNVQGETNVILKIREVWASLFSPPQLRERHILNLDHFHTGTAVIVQKMILPEASGTIMTHNPVTHNNKVVLIDAVYGFAHPTILSDNYEITKNDLTITNKKVHTQELMLQMHDREVRRIPVLKKLQAIQKISDNKIIELTTLGKKLEKHYYFPQLISWAIEKNKIYFLRSRQLDPSPHPKDMHPHATPSRYLPLLLKATPASPGLKKGPVRVVRHAKELTYVQPGDVLVMTHPGPEYMPVMKKAVAIITEQGGMASASAHASRELGIPAIIGAEKATQLLHSGVIVTVNGTTGEVYGGATHSKPHNGINTATKLYVNLNDPVHAATIAYEHIDGVGNYQSNLLLKEIGVHPQKLFIEGHERVFADKLAKELESVCKEFAPRPVFYHFTDLLSPQFRQLDGGKLYEPTETNPLLGYRGAYRLIHDPRLLSMELYAIKQIRNRNINNIWLTVPFVRTLKELEEIKRLMQAAGLQRTPTLKVWMNVSTPANLISLDAYIMSGIDGITIDLDSVISLLLGVDKHNSEVVKEFNPHDPAVLWILEQAIKICHKHHTPVGITGQTATHFPSLFEKLVNWGVTSISVELNEIHTSRKHILEAERSRIENGKKTNN